MDMILDPFACVEFRCQFLADILEGCVKRACLFRWQREGREDRQRREESDRIAREEGLIPHEIEGREPG